VNKLYRIALGTGVALVFAAALVLSGMSQVSAATSGSTPVPVNLPFQAGVNMTTNVYSAPSADSNVVGVLQAGQMWFVAGTDTTGNWTEVTLTSSGASGWVPTFALQFFGNTLPVISNVTGGPVSGLAGFNGNNNNSSSNANNQNNSNGNNGNNNASGQSANSAGNANRMVTLPFMVMVNTTTPVYNMPSATNGNVVGQLLAGQTWYVVGTDTTGKWTEIQITPNGTAFAWAPSTALALNGAGLPTIAGVTGDNSFSSNLSTQTR